MKRFFFLFTIFLGLICCKDSDPSVKVEPVTISLSQINVTVVDENNVKVSSTFSFTGGGSKLEVVDYGYVYSQNALPTVNNSTKVSFITGTNTSTLPKSLNLEKNISGLEKGKTYHIKTYLIDTENVISYSDENSFTTLNGNRFVSLATFPGNSSGGVGFFVGTNFYFGNGIGSRPTDTSPVFDFYKYDILKNTWSPIQKFKSTTGSFRSTSFVIGDKGYVATGAGGTKEVWEYDTKNDRWARKADLPGDGRDDCIGFTINNKGYVGLGAYHSDLWQFDPLDITNGSDEFGNPKGKWTKKNDFPLNEAQGGRKGTPFLVGSDVHLLIGNPLKIFKYKPVEDEWTVVTNYAITTSSASWAYMDACAFYSENKIYAIAFNEMQTYSNSSWTKIDLNIVGYLFKFISSDSNGIYLFSDDGSGKKYIP